MPHPCAIFSAVIRLAQEKGLGFIGAGYPATSLTTGRVRFCISASHTKPMLDRSLEVSFNRNLLLFVKMGITEKIGLKPYR